VAEIHPSDAVAHLAAAAAEEEVKMATALWSLDATTLS
jgi:hypothetical protein